jgi:hypothetical protein
MVSMGNSDAARPNFCPICGTRLENYLCPDDIIRFACRTCGRVYTRASYIDDPLIVKEWRDL